jgi:hypothetical protein
MGDHQVDNLQVDTLLPENFQGFQDRGQGSAHHFLIKIVGKTFEVDTGSLDMGTEFLQGLGINIAGREMADVDDAGGLESLAISSMYS